MITVIFCAITVCIILFIKTKEGSGGFMGLATGIVLGMIIAVIIPSDTKMVVNEYPLEKIGNTYLQDDESNYIIMYNSKVQTISKENNPNIITGTKNSILIKEVVRKETDLNYFTISDTPIKYTIMLKSTP